MTDPHAEHRPRVGREPVSVSVAERLDRLAQEVAALRAAIEQPRVPFYTVATLADRLAISERTVRDMLNRDEIPWYRIGPQRRIDPADADRWLADRRHG